MNKIGASNEFYLQGANQQESKPNLMNWKIYRTTKSQNYTPSKLQLGISEWNEGILPSESDA